MKKSNVQTNLLGRRLYLTEENAAAAERYVQNVDPTMQSPWVALYPAGGEVVAVYTDRDGELNITLSVATKGLVTVAASWLREAS